MSIPHPHDERDYSREERGDVADARVPNGAAAADRDTATSNYANADFGGSAEAVENKGCLSKMLNGVIGVVHSIIPPGGVLSSAFNMASASIGAGILGLPAATNSAGLVLAIIYLIVITLFSVYSMQILAMAAQNTKIKSFEGMARWLFPYGHYAFSYWAAFIRWFHAFAGCVAYIISVGNCVRPIFDEALEKDANNSALKFFASGPGNKVFTVLVWFFVMIPLVIPKHIDSLRYASALAVVFMMYFVLIIIIHSGMNGLPEHRHLVKLSGEHGKEDGNFVYLFRTGNPVIASVGVFMFAYVCQINAYEVFWDMSPEIRDTKHYTLAAAIGMAICGVLYTLVCVFGYFDFGSEGIAGKSILLVYKPLSEPAVMVAYVGVLIKLCVAYALLTIAARNSIYYLIGWQQRYHRPPTGELKYPSEDGQSRAQAYDGVTGQHGAGDARGKANACSIGDDLAYTVDDEVYVGQPSVAKKSASTHQEASSLDMDEEDFMANTKEDTSYVDNIPFWQHCLVVILLSGASLLCGLFIPNINTVFGFAGAISGGFLAFIFPALFFMYSGHFSLREVGLYHYLTTYALLICGVIGIIFGTGGTIYNTAMGL